MTSASAAANTNSNSEEVQVVAEPVQVSYDCKSRRLWYFGAYGRTWLKRNYLLVSDGGSSFQRDELREVLDLSMIKCFTKVEKDDNSYDIRLYRNKVTKSLSFDAQDNEFVEKLVATLKGSKAVDVTGKTRDEISKIQAQMSEIKEKSLFFEVDDKVLFGSTLLPNNQQFNADRENGTIPYYAVLRDLQIQLYEDYAHFAKGEKAPLHIIPLCDRPKSVQLIPDNHQKYNEQYEFAIVCDDDDQKDNSNSNSGGSSASASASAKPVSFSHFFGNVCKAWRIHLQFVIWYSIMPGSINEQEFNEMEDAKEDNDSTGDVTVNDAETQEKKPLFNLDSLIELLALTDEEVSAFESLRKTIKDPTELQCSFTDRLTIVDALYYKWIAVKNTAIATATDSVPAFSQVLAVLKLKMSDIVGCYSKASSSMAMSTTAPHVTHACPQGANCPLFTHFLRDRQQERVDETLQFELDRDIRADMNSNSNSNSRSAPNSDPQRMQSLRLFQSVKQAAHEDDMDKIHVFLFNHQQKSASASADNDNDDEAEAENGAGVADGTITDEALFDTVDVSKFVIDAGNNENAKFGFGQFSIFWIDKVYDSLYGEVCSNKQMENRLTPREFWCLYLKSLHYRNCFKTTFFARDGGGDNPDRNIEAGSLMFIQHYVSLLLYSDYTQLQREYKQSTRKLDDNEGDNQFHARAAYIANWVKYLNEASKWFGNRFKETDVVYSGISIPLVFDSFQQYIYSPMSTSESINVGSRFAGDHGIVLTLMPTGNNCDYFPLYRLSQYEHEREVFLCGTNMKIVNIQYKGTSNSPVLIACSLYVHAISLLEKLLRGQLFIDANAELATSKVMRTLLQMLDAYINNTYVHQKDIELMRQKEENVDDESCDEDHVACYQYCQKLFNNRCHQFMKMANEIWINNSELDRLDAKQLRVLRKKSAKNAKDESKVEDGNSNSNSNSNTADQTAQSRNLKRTLMAILENPKINVNARSLHYCPTTIKIVLKDELFDEFLALGENDTIQVAENVEVVSIETGNVFRVSVSLMYYCDVFPDNCLFWVTRHGMPNNTEYDVLCPELNYQFLGAPVGACNRAFSNTKIPSLKQLTLRLCFHV